MQRSLQLSDLAFALLRLAAQADDVASFRREVLAQLQTQVGFDVGFMHELTPRSPLARAGVLGVSTSVIAATLGQWDEMAVLFEPMLKDGLAHGGVALPQRAFARRRRSREAWFQRVARPLRAVDIALVHLTAAERLVAAVVLCRRARRGPFEAADEHTLQTLVPVLAACEALVQRGEASAPGRATTHRCVDGRLTARQREVVELVALGRSNAEIGAALGISRHTARNLLAAITMRLGVSNRAEVVHRAVFR